MNHRNRCWLCGQLRDRDKIIIGLGNKPVCRKCDESAERRSGKIVGKEIRDGLKAMGAI